MQDVTKQDFQQATDHIDRIIQKCQSNFDEFCKDTAISVMNLTKMLAKQQHFSEEYVVGLQAALTRYSAINLVANQIIRKLKKQIEDMENGLPF